MRSPQEGRAESFRAVLALLAMFNVGLCLAVIGPTLPDVQTRTGVKSFPAAVTVVSANAGGMIIGLLFATACFAYINVLCLMALGLVLGGLLTAALPWPAVRSLVIFLYAGQGVCLGFLVKGALVMYQVHWKRSPSMLHALYAVLALGGLVATLTTTPFAFRTLYPLNYTREQILVHDNNSVSLSAPVAKRDLHQPLSGSEDGSPEIPDRIPEFGGNSKPDIADGLPPLFLTKREARLVKRDVNGSSVENLPETSVGSESSESGNGNSTENEYVPAPSPKKPLVSYGSDPGQTHAEQKIQAKTALKQKGDQEKEKAGGAKSEEVPTTTPSTTTTSKMETTTTTVAPPPTTTTTVITTTMTSTTSAPPPLTSQKSINRGLMTKASNYWSAMLATARVMSRTQFAYVLLASCSLVSAAVFMFFCVCIPCRSVAATQKQDTASSQVIDTGVLPSRQKLYVWATLATFVFCANGVDSLIYNILTVYSIIGLPTHLDQASGSLLTAFYWSGLLVGRIGLGPGFCSKATKPKAISCLAVALLASATLAMAAQYSMPAVWLCYGILGIGLGPILPLVLSHVDSSVNLSPWFMTSTLVAGEFGRLVVPVGVAADISQRAPVDFLFAQLVLVVATTLAYMGVVHTAKAASAFTAVNSFSATLATSNGHGYSYGENSNGGGRGSGGAASSKGDVIVANNPNANVKLSLDEGEEEDIFDLRDVGVYSPSPKPDPTVVRTEADGAFDAYFGEKKAM